jgi:hypothetical protein
VWWFANLIEVMQRESDVFATPNRGQTDQEPVPQRADDSIDASVGFRSDIHGCNNPPANCPIVDDEGVETGRFVDV